VEADFRREYGIVLKHELYSMTWREFCVLLAGLSSDSRTAQEIRSRARNDSGANEVVEDPEQAEKAVAEVWGVQF